MPKNIIFCADGTCNGPNERDDQHLPDPTNVYKLFVQLSPNPPAPGPVPPNEQGTQTPGPHGLAPTARYIDGVGNSDGPILNLFGSALGAGLAARIVRGYTYLSRVFDPGDQIYLVGFSRGAYTVRVLAGLILHTGLLDKTAYALDTIPFGAPNYPANQQTAYQLGAGAWYEYQRTISVNAGLLGEFDKFTLGLPGFFQSKPQHLIPLDPDKAIAAIGVWDTVGSYGFDAAYDDAGEKTDLFPLANTRLDPRVQRGYHAVALDEQRNVFTPILWDETSNVTQRLFPGAHADIGGGYSIFQGEAHLSDIALTWLRAQLVSRGLIAFNTSPFPNTPNPAGIAHQQWRYPPWTNPGFTRAVRNFSAWRKLEFDPAIAARAAAGPVTFDPGSNAVAPPLPPIIATYRPANLPQQQSAV